MSLEIISINGHAHLLDEIRVSAARLPPWRRLGKDRGVDSIVRALGAREGYRELADRAWVRTGPTCLSQKTDPSAPLRTIHFDQLEDPSDIDVRLKLEISVFHMLVHGLPRDMIVLSRALGSGLVLSGRLEARFKSWVGSKDPAEGCLLAVGIAEAALSAEESSQGMSIVISADRRTFDEGQSAV